VASPQYQQIVEIIRSMPALESGTLEELRAMADGFGAMTAPVEGTRAEPVVAGGVPSEWVWVEGTDPDHVVFYVHGGGYVIGSIDAYRNLAAHISRATGCRVLNVDYRLAPEHPHPAAVTDATAAYRWLLGQGVDPAHVVISGDSAGGGLTLATALALRDAGDPLPAALVPISPWVDLEGTGESMTSRADVDPLVQAEGLKMMAEHFLAGGDPHDPLAAPLHADPTGLPPILIQVGDYETLLDDAVRFADLARAAGVDVTLEVAPEMMHVYQMTAGNTPEADEAISHIGAFVRSHVGLA
jgi:acetyl esterase/lipase